MHYYYNKSTLSIYIENRVMSPITSSNYNYTEVYHMYKSMQHAVCTMYIKKNTKAQERNAPCSHMTHMICVRNAYDENKRACVRMSFFIL